MNPQLIDDLLETRSLLDKRGVCTGSFVNAYNNICLDGALRTVIFGSINLPEEGNWARYMDAHHAIVDAAPGVSSTFRVAPLQYLNDCVAKGDKETIFGWIDSAILKVSQSEMAEI